VAVVDGGLIVKKTFCDVCKEVISQDDKAYTIITFEQSRYLGGLKWSAEVCGNCYKTMLNGALKA
jgi:hypothetical protein